MKPYLIALAVVILLLIGFFIFLPTSTERTQSLQSGTSSSTDNISEPTITITPLQTTVSISTSSPDFLPLTGSRKVSPGTNVKTNSSGRAVIEASSAHTTIVDYNSQVVIADDSKDKNETKIALLSGAVWARLEKVFDKGEYYEIKTSNAVATVRGTSFGVWYSNHSTTAVVTSGSIYFSAVNEKTGEVIPGTETIVNTGYKAIISGSGSIQVSKITSADTSSAWFVFNNPKGISVQPVAPPTVAPTPLPTPPPAITPPTPTPVTPQAAFDITSIRPAYAIQSSDSTITLKGDGFLKVKSLIVGKLSIQDFQIVSPTLITFTTAAISPGTYSVVLINLSDEQATSPTQLTVTPPPTPVPTPTPPPTTNANGYPYAQ